MIVLVLVQHCTRWLDSFQTCQLLRFYSIALAHYSHVHIVYCMRHPSPGWSGEFGAKSASHSGLPKRDIQSAGATGPRIFPRHSLIHSSEWSRIIFRSFVKTFHSLFLLLSVFLLFLELSYTNNHSSRPNPTSYTRTLLTLSHHGHPAGTRPPDRVHC